MKHHTNLEIILVQDLKASLILTVDKSKTYKAKDSLVYKNTYYIIQEVIERDTTQGLLVIELIDY
jgi:hypothetical protein